ncbi:MAG: polysulfide reductase NrfD [Dermatophilus congolensis]|nr:polysulfide reductase NrfD [Dermatophilus congolensis]
MSVSQYDEFRPPEPQRKRRFGRVTDAVDGARKRARHSGGKGDKRDAGAAEGRREMLMVPDVEFDSYYGNNVVKPPPWGHEIPAYLFLGGMAGGAGLIALGAQLTGREALRRNARLGSLVAVGLGGAALVADLGRPDRFYNMLRTVKLSSPMSVGSWILAGFSGGLGVAALAEADRMTNEIVPLGPLRTALGVVEGPGGWITAAFAPPLTAYTAVLLSDTANPTWNAAYRHLPFVFVSSATMAGCGLSLVTTTPDETGPVRALAAFAALSDVASTVIMESQMDPIAAEPLHEGHAGAMLRWSERLAVAGGLGAAVFGHKRVGAALSGLALMTASALTRFGVFEAGMESARDPRYTIEPQRRRLEARRAAGETGDSITTAG